MGEAAEEHKACSIERALEIIGDRWTVLVLRDAFRGLHRFDDFRRDLDIARPVLADRLRRLVEAGVLERRQYCERPPRFEYHLTPMGVDLSPALVAADALGRPLAERWRRPAHRARPRPVRPRARPDLRVLGVRADVRAHGHPQPPRTRFGGHHRRETTCAIRTSCSPPRFLSSWPRPATFATGLTARGSPTRPRSSSP